MIAIAGSKGGCGKTITTLGLAEAFARMGHPSLAVDTDRQLPDLHLFAGVDAPSRRRPVQRVEEVSRENPRQEDSYIVPGPALDGHSEIGPFLEQLRQLSMQVLLDCPSGAGPDAVDPISMADRALIVTTDRTSSIDVASTTADICRRVGVPVDGIVLNNSEGDPQRVAEAFDAPVVATVPARASPLTDGDTRRAYDRLAEQLGGADGGPRPEPSGAAVSQQRLSTGIESLDRARGGGLAPGHTVALTVSQDCPAAPLLFRVAGERRTLYLTGERSEEAVVDGVDPKGEQPLVRELPETDGMDVAVDAIRRLPDGTTVVVDPVLPLEQYPRADYLDFLNELISRIRETGGLAFLHCPIQSESPPNRSVTEQLVDTVLELRETDDGRHVLATVPSHDREQPERFEVDLRSPR